MIPVTWHRGGECLFKKEKEGGGSHNGLQPRHKAEGAGVVIGGPSARVNGFYSAIRTVAFSYSPTPSH